MLDLIRIDGSTYERWQRVNTAFPCALHTVDRCSVVINPPYMNRNDKQKTLKIVWVAFFYLFIYFQMESGDARISKYTYVFSRSHLLAIRGFAFILFIPFSIRFSCYERILSKSNNNSTVQTLMSNGSTRFLLSLLFIRAWRQWYQRYGCQN